MFNNYLVADGERYVAEDRYSDVTFDQVPVFLADENFNPLRHLGMRVIDGRNGSCLFFDRAQTANDHIKGMELTKSLAA